MPPEPVERYQWLRSGDEAFRAMLDALDGAESSVELETYIFASDQPGESFRSHLLQALQRGVRVRVLIDSFGSITLADSFWNLVREAGGDMRWFNPITLRRFQIRNHRKLMVCDRRIAFVGGFNIAPQWQGDGINGGWRDLGLMIHGPLAAELSASFDGMFERADFRHKRFIRLRRRPMRSKEWKTDVHLLLSGPGRGRSPIKVALRQDLTAAGNVEIIAAYFLPPMRLRRALIQVRKRGGRVRIILPGRSDIPLMQLAARSLYHRFLGAGVEIYEYQPQILHTKLITIDQAIYVGSSNLDARSLNINYELVVRLNDPTLATEARAIFGEYLRHCRALDAESWRQSRTFWGKLKERWAYVFFTRIDPYVARRQLDTMT